MSRLVLVTGGARSGKSGFALRLVENAPAAGKTFVATCPVFDSEMRSRVDRHRAEREGRGWRTLEETVDVAGALAVVPDGDSVLVDCLTLWINNLLYGENPDRPLDEDRAAVLAGAAAGRAKSRAGLVVMVSNEVGLGIVPDNALARRFRDVAGRVNQVVATAADEVYFMAAGLPMRLK